MSIEKILPAFALSLSRRDLTASPFSINPLRGIGKEMAHVFSIDIIPLRGIGKNGDYTTSGHVTFVVGKIGNDQILCLGGNQSQTIKVSPYLLSQDNVESAGSLSFREYYIPKAYADKLKDYKTSIIDYTNVDIANQQIINLNINSTENESTR
ncbi:MAG: hypothetical protein LBB79_03405 [Prevotellaceae bacterium]|jgi:hypothetical protein|nr:hypothetical protein [Prevotellaceae bacterium]